MLPLLWNLSAAIRGYLRFYMPTNRALDWLRTPRGLKWAIPVGVAMSPAYLYVMSICVVVIDRGGPGYLNVLVMLSAWNALKFASLAAISPAMLVRVHLKARTTRRRPNLVSGQV